MAMNKKMMKQVVFIVLQAKVFEDKNGPVDNVVPLRSEALSGSGVAAIKKADPSFQDDQFLQVQHLRFRWCFTPMLKVT